MQGVTKMTRVVSCGTALQENDFWLSLEGVLDGIEAQLRSQVGMVMDALGNAKRFHATVSCISDTGFKDATGLGECPLFLCDQ